MWIHLLTPDRNNFDPEPLGAIAEHMESYLLDYDTLETKLDFLRVQIDNTNRLVFARLNTFQNDLLIVQGEWVWSMISHFVPLITRKIETVLSFTHLPNPCPKLGRDGRFSMS